MPRVPQRYRILALAHDRAQKGDGFTRLDAAWVVGCFELAARIGELEAEGVRFNRERRAVPNHYGDPVHVTVYSLAHAPPAARRKAGVPLLHPVRPEAHRQTPF